ncbi:MAG: outer membrane protein transport protein, partial [Bacteroidales bacterium]|nr:outer membrane protein transport protein [Bacteroidales bacterium]
LQGHRQTAMGLVGVSLRGDASNLFYNPAGLSLLKNKYSFVAGGSGIFNNTAFNLQSSVYKAETDNPMGTPFFVYGATQINEKLGVGVGAYTPYGSSAKWEDDWAGAQLIQNISMKVVFIQPTVSYKINDLLSIGAGFVIATGNVELNRALPYSSAELTGQVNLQGNTTAFGYNAGVMITPNEKLSIGVDYRSKVDMEMEGGDATFTIPSSVTTLIPAANKFNATLPLPANLDFGVAYQVSEKLLLAAEINYVFWGVYDSLKFEFEEKPELLNSSNPREYSNTMIFRLGGEYIINDMITVRAGAYYDPTPTNEDYFTPETPSLTTYGLSFGFTIRPTENLAIDLSYLHLETQQATKGYNDPDGTNFTGDYKTRTMIPGIGISYNF